MTLVASLVLMAIFLPLKTQLLTLFGASENSIGMAVEYFNIILAFFLVYMLSNMMNTVIRADGSPVMSMASTLLFELAPQAVVGIFGQRANIPNPEDYWIFAEKTFRIFLSLVTFTCTIKMTSIFFPAVISSMIRDIICFIPLILILPTFYGIEGILLSAPVTDFIVMIVAAALTITYMKAPRGEAVADETAAAEHPSFRQSESCLLQNISGNTWGDRQNYELLVDNSAGLEVCADLICGYIRSAQNN